jgi:putative ABC transport system permease protein
MNEEIALHLEMERDRLIREERLSRDEANRRAIVAFGGVTQHKEELRRGRGLAWLGGVSLDTKLGFRMLVKYPGLTLVGGLAMSFAIFFGAVSFELVGMYVYPKLPLPDGDRIVQLRNWDAAANEAEPRALRDFVLWRTALKSVTELGAYRDVTRNLIVASGDDARPVAVAEITSSAFRIAPAVPLHGRILVEADERAGAPPVVLIGYELWRTRFASDVNVVGRSVRLGDSFATVVGVMPAGFAFPVAHELWMPLKVDALEQLPRNGIAISIFGKLAAGATHAKAQAELTSLGLRSAAELPDAYRNLRPRVDAYAKMFSDPSPSQVAMLLSINIFAMMLAVLLCSNVALLLFARAATRESELIVRSALGASRGRIIGQLFVEALVLGGVAAAVGLAAARFGLHRWGRAFIELNMGSLPFWYDPHLSLTSVLYAIVITVVGAAVAGVLPALKITRGLGSSLKQATAGGGGVKFGGVWTAVIVIQIAFTVAFPVVAYVEQRELRRIQSFDVGFADEEYLAVRLDMDAASVEADSVRMAQRVAFGAALERLRQRMATEPGVIGVTFVDRLPRLGHPERMIELDELPATEGKGVAPLRQVGLASIDPSYFDVLQAPILSGRAFHAGDVASGARVVIVDHGFVDQVLSGRNAVGRRFRFVAEGDEPQPWHEIVGVVKDLGMGWATHAGRDAGVYMPASLESGGPYNMVVHARGDPLSLVPTVRAIATAVDPTLRSSEPQRLSDVTDGILWILRLWLRITIALTAIAILLSLAGIYAVLSFTVARRTREIGVRVALGASPRRVVTAIFRRPLLQVAMGVMAGGVLVGVAGLVKTGAGPSLEQVALLVAYVTLMLGVCLLACVVPTWRALHVEPTVALRAE